MKVARDHPFRRHAENLGAVRRGLTQVERIHKDAIRRNDGPAINTAARLHLFTAAIATEAQLRTIIWDPAGFNERERDLVRQARSQTEQWRRAVEYAYRRHYMIPIHVEVGDSGIACDQPSQYGTLGNLITDHLEAVISDRNKTAHGEWAWHFNADATKPRRPAPPLLNYSQVKVQTTLVIEIARLVHILCVSERTFQRDFDASFARIESLALRLDGREYPELVKQLVSRRRSAG